MPGLRHEAVDVVGPDGQVDHQPMAVRAAQPFALDGIGDAGRDMAAHLLGEAQAGGLRRRGGPYATGGGSSGVAGRVGFRVEDVLARPVGERGDGQGGVGAHRAGHGRAVEHVQARIAEDLAVLVDDALAGVPSHRGAAERVHRDHPAGPPQRAVLVTGVQHPGDVPHGRAHLGEEGHGGAGRPVDVEVAPAQAHDPVGHVPAHPEQSQRPVGEAPVADQRGQLSVDPGLRRPGESTPWPCRRTKRPARLSWPRTPASSASHSTKGG